jgi:hypothetical protein
VNDFVPNALTHYYAGVNAAARRLRTVAPQPGFDQFEPQWALPEMSAGLADFFAASDLRASAMGEYRGRTLFLLDLTGNPRTRTTKTFGSLIIVARALRHIATTDEPVLLLTPSAANKAVALRDAVLRAYETGLATPAQLRVAVLVPESNLPKIWRSPLLDEPYAAANPIGVYGGPEREDVKNLATAAVDLAAQSIRDTTGFRVWYTLDPRNYMVADVVRAFFERDALPDPAGQRWHAHAVSSAYGFLGHDLGASLAGHPVAAATRYLLVQHLETPDLVLNFHPGPGADYSLPNYRRDQRTGLYFQEPPVDPHFPGVCYSTTERLEYTFYTRRPATTGRVRELFGRQGGDGIVVSLHECLVRYQEVRQWLAAAGLSRLPEDPRRLREWAMVMAVVGTLTAIDRELIPYSEVVVHGTGAYADGEFGTPDLSRLRPVATADEMASLLRKAAEA